MKPISLELIALIWEIGQVAKLRPRVTEDKISSLQPSSFFLLSSFGPDQW